MSSAMASATRRSTGNGVLHPDFSSFKIRLAVTTSPASEHLTAGHRRLPGAVREGRQDLTAGGVAADIVDLVMERESECDGIDGALCFRFTSVSRTGVFVL